MKELTRKLRPLLKNKGISDIIIFGSAAKSKITPRDIDVAILSNDKNSPEIQAVKKIVPEADVQILTIGDFSKRIFLTLIKEGYSVRDDRYIHESYGLKPIKIYKYDLKQLAASKKVMFERAIKNIPGIERLSNRVVSVPIEYSGKFEEFLRQWGMDIDTKSYELVPLMRKESF